MSFAIIHFLPRSWIKISDTGVFGISRSASSSHTASHQCLLLQPFSFNILRCPACGRPSRTWITSNRFWPSLKHLCHAFIWAALIASSLKAFRTIQIVSIEECSSLMQNLMQIHCSTCSVILNVMATWYIRSLSDAYCPHWPVLWSRHCSHTRIPVQSPWLPGYIDVAQTVLIYINNETVCVCVCIASQASIPLTIAKIRANVSF